MPNDEQNPIEIMLGYPQIDETLKGLVNDHIAGFSAKGRPLTEDEAAFAVHVLSVVSYRIRAHQSDRYGTDPFFQHAVHSLSTARDMLNQIYATQPTTATQPE